MSNASAASRNATAPKKPDPAPEPELPFDHPERLVAALFEKDSPVAWKVPLHLGNRLPHLRFGATIAANQIVITCTMPMVPPTTEEQSRFRVPPGVPTCEIAIAATALQSTISACLTVGIPCDVLDGVAWIVGRRVSQEMSMPRGARPFVERWMSAVRDLTSALVEMQWQACAVAVGRDPVHRGRRLVNDIADEAVLTWVDTRPAAPASTPAPTAGASRA
jgi:hypothetical protein